MQKGKMNRITDVDGILVGHTTINTKTQQTGVTVVMPSRENVFYTKLNAAAHVINGFGKSLGLMQVEELGTLETPIALTNTLNVGLVHDALIQYTLEKCEKDGEELPVSINPVVLECNDSFLNDICTRAVGRREVFSAIESASVDFAQGAIGAGRGTVCYGMKGGIGSASRLMEIGGQTYTLGVLVQTNYGNMRDLRIDGEAVGERLAAQDECDKGSVIIIMATDLPVSNRQLKRILKRASVGMARLGSYIGHGSGEVVLGFSTADAIKKDAPPVREVRILNENLMNIPFRAIGECTEEAILNSLYEAETVTGYEGHTVYSFTDHK
jgi:L-aminopeptidase/D-esterase